VDEHEAVLPPLLPTQVQFQEGVPVPVTPDAEPLIQRLIVGMEDKLELFAVPHDPFKRLVEDSSDIA